MKKTALFDMDGTLFDTQLANYYAYKNVLNQLGYDLSLEYWKTSCFGKNYKEFIPPISESSPEFLEEVHDRKINEYRNCMIYIRENNHLFRFIELIRNQYNIGLVTTASEESCQDVLKQFERQNCFDLVLTQKDIKKLKPDPQGYLLAMEYFHALPEDTIIFEDSEVGLEAARKTSAMVCHIQNF